MTINPGAGNRPHNRKGLEMYTRKTVDVDHTADGGPVHVPLSVEPNDRAGYAARILARREYGRSGRVGALRHDCSTTDYSMHTYEAFVGYPAAGGGICGRSIWLYVPGKESHE